MFFEEICLFFRIWLGFNKSFEGFVQSWVQSTSLTLFFLRESNIFQNLLETQTLHFRLEIQYSESLIFVWRSNILSLIFGLKVQYSES